MVLPCVGCHRGTFRFDNIRIDRGSDGILRWGGRGKNGVWSGVDGGDFDWGWLIVVVVVVGVFG